jgi:hypothetical protein
VESRCDVGRIGGEQAELGEEERRWRRGGGGEEMASGGGGEEEEGRRKTVGPPLTCGPRCHIIENHHQNQRGTKNR